MTSRLGRRCWGEEVDKTRQGGGIRVWTDRVRLRVKARMATEKQCEKKRCLLAFLRGEVDWFVEEEWE